MLTSLLPHFQLSMGIILIGQTGRYAADHAAVDSKPGGVNVSIPVPSMVAETARRLGRQQKKFIAIHNPAQVTKENCF